MAEPSSGTLNVVQCLFKDNFSVTYGSAIYSRTNQLNVVNSIFVKNRSNGFGGAIFTAKGASLMIRGSQFLSNRGREEHDVVYNPRKLGKYLHLMNLVRKFVSLPSLLAMCVYFVRARNRNLPRWLWK
jgi:predicted outer membrane repeat protein